MHGETVKLFLNRFSKNPQISNFMKIRQMGAELFHANGQTDGHDESDSRFPEFCQSAQKHVWLRSLRFQGFYFFSSFIINIATMHLLAPASLSSCPHLGTLQLFNTFV
jgi:hypothetical protein